MKTTSPLLSHLSRSIPNAFPEPNDTEIDIDPEVVNSLTIPFAFDTTNVPSNNAPQNSSWHISNTSNVNAASGELLTLLATLTKGLWEFNILGSMSSNYTTLNFFEHYCYLLSPAGHVIPLLGFQCGGSAANPAVQTSHRTIRLLLPADNFTVRMQARNNAAGQNCNSAWGIQANRLL